MHDILEQMRRRVMRHTTGTSRLTAVPRLAIGISTTGGGPVANVYEPMICLVLQGAKEITVGDRVLRYDTASCFLASVDIPAVGRIMGASPASPYIVTSLRLDRQALAGLLADCPPEPPAPALAGFGTAPVTMALLQAWDALLALLDTPQDIPFLGPGREREVLYRLLSGNHGPLLRQIGREDSRLSRIRRTIETIRDHFDQPLRTESLAAIAGMSVPTFHRHFRNATNLSPLQYQKALRLQRARHLLSNSHDVTSTAFEVGYESASQFSREYARQFGAPPSRHLV